MLAYRLTPSKHLSNMEGNGQGEEIVAAAASPKYELVFEGISVSIGEKIILQNVSGTAQSGKLLAIMGQSGSFIWKFKAVKQIINYIKKEHWPKINSCQVPVLAIALKCTT